MSTVAVDVVGRSGAREVGWLSQVATVTGRALRRLPREPITIIQPLVVPVFFYAINVGQLETVAARFMGAFDYKSFLLPGAIVFAVTGVSRATTIVSDIQLGYFERLMLTPVGRVALLIGHMAADFLLVCVLCLPVIAMAAAMGVHFVTGVPGLVVFVLMSACWGLAFTGFLYAVALWTGSPAAVTATFVIFFPFVFLTSAFVPQELLAGWMSTVADFNPVTYLLNGLRSLLMYGWEPAVIGRAFLAIGLTGVVSMSLCLLALRHRTHPR